MIDLLALAVFLASTAAFTWGFHYYIEAYRKHRVDYVIIGLGLMLGSGGVLVGIIRGLWP